MKSDVCVCLREKIDSTYSGSQEAWTTKLLPLEERKETRAPCPPARVPAKDDDTKGSHHGKEGCGVERVRKGTYTLVLCFRE